MSRLLVFIAAFIFTSCSLTPNAKPDEPFSSDYQYGRQMDEKSIQDSFYQR
jgi:hypothetical protein